MAFNFGSLTVDMKLNEMVLNSSEISQVQKLADLGGKSSLGGEGWEERDGWCSIPPNSPLLIP